MDIEEFSEKIQGSITKLELTGKFPSLRSWCVAELVDSSDLIIHGGSVSNRIFGEINYLSNSKKHWLNIQEVSREDLFMMFDKSLSGHTSTVIQKNSRKIMLIFGGFDGLFYSNSIYSVNLGNIYYYLCFIDDFCFNQIDIRGKGEYPAPRCFHTTCYDKVLDCLFVYGGWNGNITQSMGTNFSVLWKFDVKGKNQC